MHKKGLEGGSSVVLNLPFREPRGCSQLPVSLAPGNLIPSSGLFSFRHTHATHTHKNKINKIQIQMQKRSLTIHHQSGLKTLLIQSIEEELKLVWASQHTCCSLRGKTGFPYNQEINESGTRGRHAAFFSSRSEGLCGTFAQSFVVSSSKMPIICRVEADNSKIHLKSNR